MQETADVNYIIVMLYLKITNQNVGDYIFRAMHEVHKCSRSDRIDVLKKHVFCLSFVGNILGPKVGLHTNDVLTSIY